MYAITGSFCFDRNDLHLTDALKNSIMEKCAAGAYQSFGQYQVQRVEDIDGYKFHLDDHSWVMIRASGTEPLLRVYAEASDRAATDAILEAAEENPARLITARPRSNADLHVQTESLSFRRGLCACAVNPVLFLLSLFIQPSLHKQRTTSASLIF